MRSQIIVITLLLTSTMAFAQSHENPPEALPDAANLHPSLPYGITGVPFLNPDFRVNDIRPCSLDLNTHKPTTIKTNPWPGVVPYEFDSNVTPINRNLVRAAMNILESVCLVHYIFHTSESAYIHIQSDMGNSSSEIGYTDGQTIIRLYNFNEPGVIIHELMHSLGFYHEQCRSDRDQYIVVQFDRIKEGYSHNFERQDGSFRPGPYDFFSLMHYGKCYFTVCSGCTAGCETILMKQGYEQYQDKIGNRTALSPLDTHGLRSLYQRPEWRFVDPLGSVLGTGSGINPWFSVSTAMQRSPANTIVFVMPGSYSTIGTWGRPMTLVGPVGGVTLGK